MRITLVIEALGGGGAERVVSVMSDYWAKHGQEVTLITLALEKEDFYTLHPQIHRIALGLRGPSPSFLDAIRNNVMRVKGLRHAIKTSRPDCVLSLLDTTNVLTLAATLGLKLPIIACEHTDPRQGTLRPVWQWLRRLFYPRAAALVVLTESVRCWAERLVERKAVYVIPNSIPAAAIQHNGARHARDSGGTISAMGRLVALKGFDMLLEAFSRCADKHRDWSLIILGEGAERSRLENLARELGIADRVRMPGLMHDPFRILRETDLFVLSSRREGFPMALVEAMACGLPVIAADCPSGPRDIIRDGVDGVLVPPSDVDALTAAMDRLMTDQVERQRLGAKAPEVTERFSIDKVMEKWDEVFSSLPSGKLKANPS
jgi:glycosyltransferase involved in cell wall biosynthesis